MSRQSRLVLLLLLSIGVVSHVVLASTPHPRLNVIHDDIPDNQLDLKDDILPDEVPQKPQQHIRISTPKVKDVPIASTTSGKSESSSPAATTEKTLSDTVINDLVEATKHSDVLAKDERLNRLINKKLAGSSTTTTVKPSEDNYDSYDDNYDYDEDEDNYNYEDITPKVVTKVSKNKAKASAKMEKKSFDAKPIKEDTKTSSVPKKNLEDHNKESNTLEFHEDSFNADDDDDDDDDYDDDDEDFDSDTESTDDDENYSEHVPCPRYCTCQRNVNSYLVAYCSRIDPDTQKFGKDITDLVVTDVGPKYPILLGPEFFLKLGLKHMSSLKISNCTIEYLHHDAFKGLNDLFSVNLTEVGLAIINPDTFANNTKLRLLTISGNDLSVMSSVHYLLKSSSIEELDLSRNNLMELNPNAFSELSNVVYINLSQNNLQKIPDGVFDKLETIEELDLSYNALKSMPPTIFNHTALAILHLKYNAITNDLRFGTSDLQQLDLSFNRIHTVHHGMFDKMTSLTNLNLKGNGLTKIQADSFLTLKNLRHIDLSINEVDQISSMMFFKNSELDVIRLNDNPRLSQLPTDGFRSYSGGFTTYLFDVSNCAISSLGHKTFSTMPHLTTLKLAWNNINNLERDTFEQLNKLIELDLSNNLIAKLDDLMFMNNNDLTKLNLAGNPIHKLNVRLFMPFTKLRELDVSDCELKSLLSDNQYGMEGGYKFYETLRSFNASANHIHKIHSSDVRQFKNLRSLDVTHNPIKCNEDFQDFIKYVSLHTQILPQKVSSLANLDTDGNQLQLEAHAGWSSLAHEVCKHEDLSHDLVDDNKIEERLEDVDKDLDDDTKNLMNIMENNRLQKILKDSHKRAEAKNKIDVVDDDEDDSQNTAEEEKDDVSSEKSDYEYDDNNGNEDEDDDDETDEDNVDDYEDYEKKADISKKIKDHGIQVQEIDLEKETRDERILGKFLPEGTFIKHTRPDKDDDDEDDDDDDEEYIIERGRIYYSGYKFLVPIIIIVTCILVLMLAIAKVVSMVLRKRGERYRMSILQAHKNSIVYQKLTEDIVVPKEPKQPKVHRYEPIHSV